MAHDIDLILTAVETYLRGLEAQRVDLPGEVRARAQRVSEMLSKAARSTSRITPELRAEIDRLFPVAQNPVAPAATASPAPVVRRPAAVSQAVAPAVAAPTLAPPAHYNPAAPERPSYFEEGEPTRFTEFVGQEKVIDYLTNAVHGLDDDELAIRPVFFIGPAGLGKTTIAKVVAYELQMRAMRLRRQMPEYMGIMPVEVPNVTELDKIMRRVQARPGSIVFIDEFHAVAGKEHFLKLYQALINGRYRFEGEKHAVKLPPTTFVAATTDYGALPEALMSRFAVQQLVPASPEALTHMLKQRKFPISDPAADMIVDRTGATGVPREVLELYHEAVVFAKGGRKKFVGLPEVKRACDNQGIDRHGLRARDRIVIEMLLRFPRTRRLRNGGEEFVGYVQSERTIFTVTQIDPAYYQKNVEPRLIARGFLEIRNNGRALTKKAEQLYAHLIPQQSQYAHSATSAVA